jgi:predicted DNA-binding ribbon-helix-helix protein
LLDEIAAAQGISTPKFLSLLHDEALEIHGGISNFASMLRTTCLLYLRGHQPDRDGVAGASDGRRIVRGKAQPAVTDPGSRFRRRTADFRRKAPGAS